MKQFEIIQNLDTIIERVAKFKNSYFWSSPANARSRRDYEKYYSIPEIEFEFSGHTYTAAFSVECTCNNIYAKGIYTKDGNKTNLTAIKNVLAKMKEVY